MTVAFLAAILAAGAIAAVAILILRDRSRDHGPDFGLALVAEDPTHDDDGPTEGCDCEDCESERGMDAYLDQRAEGNGVLPPSVHYPCFDAWSDGKPAGTCEPCREQLESQAVTHG